MAISLRKISSVSESLFREGSVDPNTKELIVKTLKCEDPGIDEDLKAKYKAFKFFERVTNNVELVLIVLGFVRLAAKIKDVRNNFDNTRVGNLFGYLGTNDPVADGLFLGERRCFKSAIKSVLEQFGLDEGNVHDVIDALVKRRKQLLWISEQSAVVDEVADLIKSSFVADLSEEFRKSVKETIGSIGGSAQPHSKKVVLKDLLFTKRVYDKRMKSESRGEQLQYAKDTILHAYACFAGVCKYVYSKNVIYGKFLQDLTGFPLDNIEWNEDFIKSLKDGDSWKLAAEQLSLSFEYAKNIKHAENIYQLVDLLADVGEYDYPPVLDDGREDTAKLCVSVKSVFDTFNEWLDEALRYLYKIEVIQIESSVSKEAEENEKANERKRNKVAEDKEKNKKIDDDLRERQSKIRRLESGEKKSLSQTVKESNEAYAKLKKAGILSVRDDTEVGDEALAVSSNFVKLFIRYLERTYSSIADCVKIYYYASIWDTRAHAPDSDRADDYWMRIRYLKHKSKDEDVIYFVVNQFNKLNVADFNGVSCGHGNLTIVCNGKYKIFESVAGLETKKAPGSKFFGNKINVSGGTIQHDIRNCLNITLGYLESLMKQISRNKEKWKSGYKSVSRGFSADMNKYDTVTLPENIVGLDKENPFKVLLPTKYIKYMQSKKGMQALIDYAEKMDKENKDYAILQEVSKELKAVIAKYDLSNQSVEAFFKDALSKGDGSYFDDFENLIERMDKPNITVKDLLEFLENGLAGLKNFEDNMEEQFDDDYDEIALVNLAEEGSKELVEKELQKNEIYGLFCEAESPLEMTYRELCEMRDFCGNLVEKLKLLLKINDRAQMKRRTQTLKIAALVDSLSKNDSGVDAEIGAVRDFFN